MEQQVLQLLEGTLKSNTTTIRNSEKGLTSLYSEPHFPFALLSIATSENVAIGSRQSSLTYLKTYVSRTWSPSFDETFQGNVYLDDNAKRQVRDQIFSLAVTQSTSKGASELYKLAASVTSKIASADYPDQWPDLLFTLLNLINSQHNDSTIQSALTVLSELIDSALSEDQFFSVARDLVNTFYQVATNSDLSLSTRALALNTFSSCFGTLEMVMADHGTAVKAFLDESLKSWVSFFIGALQEPLPPIAQPGASPSKDDPRRGVITLKVQVVKVLDKIRQVYAAGLSLYAVNLFQVIWDRLTKAVGEYTQVFVEGYEEGNLQGDDGLPCSLDALVVEEIDFLQTILKAPPVRLELDKQLRQQGSASDHSFIEDLLGLLVQFACPPNEQVDMWEADPEIYLSEVNLVMANYTPRSACAELAVRTLYAWQKDSLFDAMLNFDKGRGAVSWKSNESFLFLLNQVLKEADMADAKLSQGTGDKLLEQVSGSLQDSNPYVRSGAHLALGSFFVVAPDGLADAGASAFAASISAARTDDSDVVKVACFSAVPDYIQSLPANTAASLQRDVIDAVADFLHSHDVKEDFEDAEELKSALMVAIRDAMLMNPAKIGETSAVDSFLTLASDGATTDNTTLSRLSAESFENIVEAVARRGNDVFNGFCAKTLPALMGAFDVASMTAESNLINLAAELVSVLAEFGTSPLPDGFVAAAMPKLQRVLMSATADLLVQPATTAVQHMLNKATEQFLQWKDRSGTSSLETSLTIINRLLNAPDVDESAAQEVGGLASAVVGKFGTDSLGPYLMDLLRALATRLATAERVQFIQSLCMVFVALSIKAPAEVVAFLHQLDIHGSNGLQVVLTKWLENSVVFAGFDDVRQNIVALSKLFDLQDERIRQIGVKGDLIVENTGRIKTRSQAKLNPDRYTTIPADVKILKLLVEELSSAASSAQRFLQTGGLEEAVSDDEADGEDGDWEDDPGAIDLSSKAMRDELMNFADGNDVVSDRGHDSEAIEYLAGWFRANGAQSGFQERFAQLNQEEQEKLRALLG